MKSSQLNQYALNSFAGLNSKQLISKFKKCNLLDETRAKQYSSLEKIIGNTPIILYHTSENNNRVYIKRECDNPFGSHYDRVYLQLFLFYEGTQQIKKGQKIIETTSGAAGASFAGIGKELGYECIVAIPQGTTKKRENAIKKYLISDNHLINTPKKDYIAGFPNFIRNYLKQNKDVFFLNHSMGPAKRDGKNITYENNEHTLKALESVAEEIIYSLGHVDYFVPAVGNGSSVLGPGRYLKLDNPKTFILAYESFQSAVAYNLKYPKIYQHFYKLEPGTLDRHNVFGTSYNGIDFPHLNNSLKIINEIRLFSDSQMDYNYSQKTNISKTGLPCWDSKDLVGLKEFGRSTKAGVAVALFFLNVHDHYEFFTDKNFVVIAYDKSDRY
jgi:cysteine synthase A